MNATKKLKKTLLFLIVAIFAFCFFSCKNKQKAGGASDIDNIDAIYVPQKDHTWYAFVQNEAQEKSFEKVDLPQNAKRFSFAPWTESVRVCDSLTLGDFFCVQAVFLVNRLGLITFQNGTPDLHPEYDLFSFDTACNLFSKGKDVFFTFYKDRLFNTQPIAQPTKNRTFMARFDIDNGLVSPLISYSDLGLQEDSEITLLAHPLTKETKENENNDFDICVKDYKKEKLEFSYYNVTSKLPLENLEAFQAKDLLKMSPIKASSFYAQTQPAPLDTAPNRIKELFATLPEGFYFSVTAKTLFKNYSQYYQTKTPSLKNTASCAVAPSCAVAVFTDGTTFLKRANDANLVALRLPLLPPGYEYGAVALSGDFLIVAWEEKDFFNTSRSGFLSVDLKKVLD